MSFPSRFYLHSHSLIAKVFFSGRSLIICFFLSNNKQKYSRFHYQRHLCREHPAWHSVNTISLNFSGKKGTIFNTYSSSSSLLPSLSLLSSFFLSFPPFPSSYSSSHSSSSSSSGIHVPLKMNFLLSQLIFLDYE